MKKFTFFIMMLVMCATTTFAQTAITSLDDVKTGKIYWFQNRYLTNLGYASSLYYPGVDGWNDYLWSSAGWLEADDPQDPNEHFAFVEYEGKFYLYSVGADNFVTYKDDGAHITAIPTSFVTVQANTVGDVNYPWCIAFDGDKLIGQYYYTGYEYSGYLYCSGNDTADELYAWQIYEIGDLTNAEELTERLASAMNEGDKLQKEACDNLLYKIEEAEEYLSELNYLASGGGKVELQVTDETAGNYIWSNEPELSEGPIEGLIDNDVNTFFHSRWNETAESVHWLQIDLENEIQNFSFTYTTRTNFESGLDYPDAIEVQGSNDGHSFETIAVFDNNLPHTNATPWESGNIYADKAYKHLRFVVTASRVYFHMSEFAIYRTAYVSVDEAYKQYEKYITKLAESTAAARTFWEAHSDASATTDEYNAYIDEVEELLDIVKGLISGEPDDKTVEYISYVEEILAIQGVGYPGEAPRAAYQTLIDVAKANPTTQARFDLEDAFADYIKTDDITLPTNGEKYTLTFITYSGRWNYLNYDGDYALSMVRDTLTTEGLPLPESAAFTCVDNGDGTFDFMTADGKYFTTPGGSTASGSRTGISDTPTCFVIEKMHPNSVCEADVTDWWLFGLVALNNAGVYMAPNSSGKTFYVTSLPYLMSSWTSAMYIRAWTTDDGTNGIEDITVESTVKGIYDLQGRKVENPSAGIYIVNGKKTFVK